MSDEDACFPEISTVFGFPSGHANNILYHDAIRNILEAILPKNLFNEQCDDAAAARRLKDKLQSHLPLLKTISSTDDPLNMSFFCLSKYRPNAFRFFFEMISHWLVPGRRLNVLLIYAADLRLPQISSAIYTVCEVMVRVADAEELEIIRRNYPVIESEVRLGMESSFYARRILEVKGLSADEKTALIQEYIAYLVKRLPKEFDQEVLTEMQHVLVICRDDFKAFRDCRHLSRIISAHYLFRKALRESVKAEPALRHVSLKLFRSTINSANGLKKVLSITVGINFLKDKEVFEQKHLLSAIQNYVPKVLAVPNSFFANRSGSDNICTLYLEVEKEDGAGFTSEEIIQLRRELPREFREGIEHLMHPVFMPRNEEDIMRNILSLSNQIKFVRDLPQVWISFDEQTYANLFFTVILVRVLTRKEPSIQDLFKEKGSLLTYTHDRCKLVGSLRKKYPKEATVFRVKLPKESFLRKDHSINLYEARQAVVLELLRIVGEFRDYNGGMISKQNEVLTAVRKLLGDETRYNELLLENFFYSLAPVMMRTLLQPEAFASLFEMLLESMEHKFNNCESVYLDVKNDASFVFVLLKTPQRAIKEELHRLVSKHTTNSSELANAYVQMYNIHCIGYIYRSDDPVKQQAFMQQIRTLAPQPQEVVI